MHRAPMFVLFLILAQWAGPALATQDTGGNTPDIDPRSYNLGVIGAFAEMVGVGVKKLALSAPLDPEEMEALLEDARRIAERNGASVFLEKNFLTTDLFPAAITRGKHVLLIYAGSTKEEYLALKREKEDLVRAGRYAGEARREIARKMGRLLSYPEERIEQMLERAHN